MATDKKMADMMYPFSPFFNLLVLNKPFEISRNASMTDAVVGSASEWLTRQRRDLTRAGLLPQA